jgi:hypothetical protein
LRADFDWWGKLDDEVATTFSVWIKSQPNVRQNALLSVDCLPGGSGKPYRFDFQTKERVEGGSVVEYRRGRLIVDFPRSLLAGYGPRASWWGLAAQGDNDLDHIVDPDAGLVDLSQR